MPPNRFESEVESFLEGSHGDRTHIKRADHHTVTPLCGTLLTTFVTTRTRAPQKLNTRDPHDAPRKRRARLRCPWAVAGPGGLRGDAPSRRLAARTASGRAAAHGHTKQPGPTRRPEHPWDHKQGL